MDKSLAEKVKSSIKNLKERNSKIYLMVQDTKGNARASVRYIYQIGMFLKKNGFNPIMLHEKNDYTGVEKWLGESYMKELPHKSVESQNLEISPEDFIVIPEIFAYVMEQIKNLPCGKIVLTQSYAYMLDTLQPGQTWAQNGFYKCITTTEKQKEYIQGVMRQSNIDVLTPVISNIFTPRTLPAMPIIAVHTRDHSDTVNLIKTFYLKYPQYRWFTFRDMRGLSEIEFAETLKQCFLAVWIDDQSGFGTFPLECMACNIPIIGKVPDLQPEWLNENNGIWITDKLLFTDFVADFIQNWLEDNIKPEIYSEMMSTADNYKDIKKFEENLISLFDGYLNLRSESLEAQLEKIEE